jgi:exo-rhamnogalacturonan lyase-like protein
MLRAMLVSTMIAVFVPCALGANVEVPLTVTERAGVARVANHVNSGVPLPMGAVKDMAELALFDAAGKPVNAQITERCRWLKDKSLKFVTVHFLCNLPAKGVATYVLKTAKATPTKTLKTQATADAVTVDTGVVKFTVKKAGYNLFDRVAINGKQVVAPGTAKLTLVATEGECKIVNKLAKVASESGVIKVTPVVKTLELEENGPVRAVVKVTGEFAKESGKTLDFVARYYALAGSSTVRVVFTVVNRVGKKFASFVGVRELSMTVPAKGTEYVFAGEKADISGTVAAGKATTLLQLKSTECTLNGKTHKGGKDTMSRRLGWVSLGKGDSGLAVGTRYFWQLYPKGFEVTGDASVKVMLVAPGDSASRAGASGVPFFTGAARTHEVLFSFGGSGAVAMGVVDPLFAVAPTDWYCQKTSGFGRLYDANPNNFKPEYQAVVKKFQANLDGSFKTVLGRKSGRSNRGMEEYGFFNWGAGVHHGSVVKGTWLDTGWNGNYYDFPFSLIVNFVRTGNPVNWDIAQAHALHIADVDVCQWHPTNQKLNGIEHVCYSIGHFRQFWRAEPFGVSGNADSTKNQSLYHCYYMTGDRRYLDVARLVSDYNAAHGGGALRARGNRMTGLYGSYEQTHDPEHFKRWKAFVYKQGIGLAKSRGTKRWDQEWMYGMAAEGLMTYYRTTGDLMGAEAARTACDSLVSNYWDARRKATRTIQGFTVACFGYAYELTGDEEYLTKGVGQLAAAASRGGSRSKAFAQQFRISPQFLTYLAKDYKLPKPVLTDKRIFQAPKPRPPKPPKSKVSGGKGEFPATRDIRIMTHASEAEQNGGGSRIGRVRNVNSKSGELPIIDFDTQAIKAFLDANKGKEITAVLSLKLSRVQNGPAPLRVVPLRSTVDWVEGTLVQKKANKGTACYAWAKLGEKRWTNAEGKEVPDVRATFYDRAGRKLLRKENSKPAKATRPGEIHIELDDWLVKDLAENPNNRGLILFTAQSVDGKQAIIDLGTREIKKGAVLRLTTPDAGKAPMPKPSIKGKTAVFQAYRDARISCHPSEETQNSGRATRLRIKNANSKSGELSILDFNTDAMKAFLNKHKGKGIKATLVLKTLQLQYLPATLQVTGLVSASDWREGDGVGSAAKPGQCNFKWAQHGKLRWKTADGKDAADIRALFYDKPGKKPTVKINAATVEIKAGIKTVEVPIDEWLIKDLAENPNNRGLVLFVAQPMNVKKAVIDFKSKEAKGNPHLKLEVVE